MLRFVLPFCFCLIFDCHCQSQITAIARDHSCEGDVTWDVPACESAWRPHISAVFLGHAVDVRKEDVPILLEGEKALTERLHVTFEVEEGYILRLYRGSGKKCHCDVRGRPVWFPFFQGT